MNEKLKEPRKLYSVRIKEKIIDRIEKISKDRKANNMVDWSIQSIVESALERYLKQKK